MLRIYVSVWMVFVMQITSFPIEILIYDDASGDGTQNIIEEYQKKYPDIINQYIKLRINIQKV